MSKSLAVESMHRICKHFTDVMEDPKKSLAEIADIAFIWEMRGHFEGLDLNAALAKLRHIRAGGDEGGWKTLGRKGFTTG